jgi:hypothetical protein
MERRPHKLDWAVEKEKAAHADPLIYLSLYLRFPRGKTVGRQLPTPWFAHARRVLRRFLFFLINIGKTDWCLVGFVKSVSTSFGCDNGFSILACCT